MVTGRDAVLVKHEGGKSKSQQQKEDEKAMKWNKVLKDLLKRTNKDGGQNAIESE